MLFIVHPNYEQDRMDVILDEVKKEIISKGGTVLKTDNWGKRKLAYLINKQRYGSYVLMYFEADPTVIQGLQEWMEIQAQVLHQIIIRLEEKPEISESSENPDSSYPSSRSSHGSQTTPKKEEAPKAVAEKEKTPKVVVEKEEVKEEEKKEAVVEEIVTEGEAEEVVPEKTEVEAIAEETEEGKGE